MSILGKFNKQPMEVEAYTIDYSLRLSETDSIQSFYCALLDVELTKDKKVGVAPFGTLNESGVTAICEQSMTLADLPDNSVVTIANVGTVPLLINGSMENGQAVIAMPIHRSEIFRRVAGEWKSVAGLRASIIDSPANLNIKCFVELGEDNQSLQPEFTVTTADGRVIQSEFRVKVREI